MERLLIRRLIEELLGIFIQDFRVVGKELLQAVPNISKCQVFKKGKYMIEEDLLYVSHSEYKRLCKILDNKWKTLEMKSYIFSLQASTMPEQKEAYLNMILNLENQFQKALERSKDNLGIEARGRIVFDARVKEEYSFAEFSSLDFDVGNSKQVSKLVVKLKDIFNNMLITILTDIPNLLKEKSPGSLVFSEVDDDDSDINIFDSPVLNIIVSINPNILFEYALANNSLITALQTGLYYNIKINEVLV